MGLTQVSTDGVKNDAITKTKIPSNQIEASELADNAVDTNAIANDAVTRDKIADDVIASEHFIAGEVDANALASGAVTTAKIADQAVSLDKLPHGDSNNNGKFLRANNGADPSFETITIPSSINNVVEDTSPQLGGSLDIQSHDITGTGNIELDDSSKIKLGTGDDLQIFHSGGVNQLTTGNTVFKIFGGGSNNKTIFATATTNAAELYFDNSKKLETTSSGASVTGYVTQSALPSACVYGAAAWTTVNAGTNTHPLAMFPNSAHNIGSMYNNSTGKMTAPVAGIYQIHINLFCQGLAPETDSTNNAFEMYLKVNNNTLARHHGKIGYGNMGDNQQKMVISCVEDLNANDEVTIFVGASSGGNWQMYGHHSTFQMTLIG